MGKGYNNYMCKKPFHPGSKANIKRAWMAEQRTENEKKKQDDLRVQYEKEQDLYNNKALLSKESKDKLALNFMYEAPPGAKRERQKEDDEPEYKFEWQRKYNAPREDFAKDNKEIRDQPFGIQVRNVRCIKCHQWGHLNTDKECPLYNQASSSSMPTTSMDPLELIKQMSEEGLTLKKSVLGHRMDPTQDNQHFIDIEDEEDPEIEFLKSLSTKQKKKLLRKLNKLSKKQKEENARKKKKKNRKGKKHSSDSSSSNSDDKRHRRKKKKKKAVKKSKHQSSSSSSSSSDSSSSESSSSSSSESSSSMQRKRKHTGASSEPCEKYPKLEKRHDKYHQRSNNSDRESHERTEKRTDSGCHSRKDSTPSQKERHRKSRRSSSPESRLKRERSSH